MTISSPQENILLTIRLPLNLTNILSNIYSPDVRRYKTTKMLFNGRYKSIIDADAYLLELTRYVALNPVRAGMLEDVNALNLLGKLMGLLDQSH